MALTPFSLLLFRNLSSSGSPNIRFGVSSLIRKNRAFWFSHGGNFNLFSTSQSSLLQNETNLPKLQDPKTSLSARMSFVFDQIDAIEKERSGKDEALQRIRAWRETKKKRDEQEVSVESQSSLEREVDVKKKDNLFKKDVELVHPWPEWVELMERLVQQNYFDHRRIDEDRMIPDLPIDVSEFAEEGFDFTRDWTTVRNACLNFGRDRFDILRSLSRQDIQILVGHGCPSVDNKVVFSAKLLRKHVHLDEGDVCSSCSLRNSCDRAYLLTLKEDEARTLDVMRILLTFGFDPVNGSENKLLLKMKSVKTVVRKLLHEVVKLSAVPIDPNLPPPVIKKPPPKVKQPPPPPKRRVGRDDIEMKKGDWLCPKCDFMNFAKNSVCLQCDAKRPKRQLLPGEWECPECNFLNYRRNMACFHCDHKRPPDEFMENQMQGRNHGPRTRLERVASMPGVSSAWNFDFDDNESDGADVAAFEFADSPRMDGDSSLDCRSQEGNSRGFEDDSFETGRVPRAHEGDRYSVPNQKNPGMGFDDFDDEEDDDVDSYELDTPNGNSIREASSKNFSHVEGFSESEDSDSSRARQGTSSFSYQRPSMPMQRKSALSGSEDYEQDFESDKELSVHPNWKSSHIADSRQRSRGRGGNAPFGGMSFGSEDELDLNSDSDDDRDRNFGSKRSKYSSNIRDVRRGGSLDSEGDYDVQSRRNNTRGHKVDPGRRGNASKGRGHYDSARDTRFRSNDMTDNRRNSPGYANLDKPFRVSNRNDRGSLGDRYGGSNRNDRGSQGDRFGGSNRNARGSQGDRYGGSNRNARGSQGNHYGGRWMNDRDGHFSGDDRPRRRIIER